jgi:GNAT superfamily N-acetyltransferase
MVYGGMKFLIPAKDTEKDCRFIYNLRNKDYVRNASWNTEKFPYESHKKWYKKNYKNIFIIRSHPDYIGFVRIDDDKSVSIALIKEQQNLGIGSLVLEELAEYYKELKAEVKIDNLHSLSFFIKNDFRLVGWILERKNKFMKRL